MHEDIYFSLIALAIAGLALLYFRHHNKDSMKVERFFYEEHRSLFHVLQFALFFLLLTMAIYSRVIASHVMEIAKQKLTRLVKIKSTK